MEIRLLLPKLEEKFISMSLKVPLPVIIFVSIDLHRVPAFIHLSQPRDWWRPLQTRCKQMNSNFDF